MSQLSDIEIARNAKLKNIKDIASKIGLEAEHLISFGEDKAKIKDSVKDVIKEKKDGKLILVTAISPTSAGEGKTTTTVGIGDALWQLGKKTVICLREPSLGPCFGMKGGAAGGGYAQVVPMEDINLHFTGDFHAITSAHNLISAMLDNHIYWGNQLNIDTRRINWKRVIDLNDRSLRQVVTALGGVANGFVMQNGFDITVASEIMAILCLAKDTKDLERRINNVIVAYDRNKNPVFAEQLQVAGAVSVLLKDALLPNLVQTIENNPAFIHGGPFANIAHGCNSVRATKTALKLAEFVVTEAGFGADLGAEKFLNIKCPKADIKPDAVVIVATIRALKMNGGAQKNQMFEPNPTALEKGLDNLDRHIYNIKRFGLPILVAINHFEKDLQQEVETVQNFCQQKHNVEAVLCTHWKNGGAGTKEIAEKIVQITRKQTKNNFQTLYPENMPIIDKIRTIAQKIYHAKDISCSDKIKDQILKFQEQGYGKFPICMAKTQYSFSVEPSNIGAPKDHIVTIREVRVAAGAEFIVVICGNIMTMPGLPAKPAANKIKLDDDGLIQGLF